MDIPPFPCVEHDAHFKFVNGDMSCFSRSRLHGSGHNSLKLDARVLDKADAVTPDMRP